eukprot:3305704-Rhodomonas_salina.1
MRRATVSTRSSGVQQSKAETAERSWRKQEQWSAAVRSRSSEEQRSECRVQRSATEATERSGQRQEQ